MPGEIEIGVERRGGLLEGLITSAQQQVDIYESKAGK
jgi:hypothetical protein